MHRLLTRVPHGCCFSFSSVQFPPLTNSEKLPASFFNWPKSVHTIPPVCSLLFLSSLNDKITGTNTLVNQRGLGLAQCLVHLTADREVEGNKIMSFTSYFKIIQTSCHSYSSALISKKIHVFLLLHVIKCASNDCMCSLLNVHTI